MTPIFLRSWDYYLLWVLASFILFFIYTLNTTLFGTSFLIHMCLNVSSPSTEAHNLLGFVILFWEYTSLHYPPFFIIFILHTSTTTLLGTAFVVLCMHFNVSSPTLEVHLLGQLPDLQQHRDHLLLDPSNTTCSTIHSNIHRVIQ